MERKIVLEIEELEERIAPHGAPLGHGHAAVEFNPHPPESPTLLLPNGNEIPVPVAAVDGLTTAKG